MNKKDLKNANKAGTKSQKLKNHVSYIEGEKRDRAKIHDTSMEVEPSPVGS